MRQLPGFTCKDRFEPPYKTAGTLPARRTAASACLPVSFLNSAATVTLSAMMPSFSELK
jgi:hypothetical protein